MSCVPQPADWPGTGRKLRPLRSGQPVVHDCFPAHHRSTLVATQSRSSCRPAIRRKWAYGAGWAGVGWIRRNGRSGRPPPRHVGARSEAPGWCRRSFTSIAPERRESPHSICPMCRWANARAIVDHDDRCWTGGSGGIAGAHDRHHHHRAWRGEAARASPPQEDEDAHGDQGVQYCAPLGQRG
jgi:hypothetical protein